VDAIALVAMLGALALQEYLAGAVIALMLAGGNALEASASRRARRALTALVERAPRIAHRRRAGRVEEVPVADVGVGDTLIVRAGEIVPVDGIVVSEAATLDESTLTGETLPSDRGRGSSVRSGTSNAGDVFDMRTLRPAAESTYAALVRLVEGAESQRAPFVRLADRYAAFFLPLTLAVAGLAWALSGSPVRALAVLVVATPCPLILAAPIALISGVSRAARSGVIVKGGAVIERLGGARTVLLDKTGTLTLGTPTIESVVVLDGLAEGELLRAAASLDQLSAHVLGEAIVHDAEGRGLELEIPEAVIEQPGQGIEGMVGGRRVTVGSEGWLRERGYETAQARSDEPQSSGTAGHARVLVGVEGKLAGVIVMADHLRSDAPDLVAQLRAAGVRRVAMVSGDRAEVANEIARRAAIDEVYAEKSPEDKLDIVRALQESEPSEPVVMVGDGVNDAPALALADVGIAMGVVGATVSSETADAVIMVDRIDRVAEALRIGRRSLAIARQSVLFGIGLSLAAMGFAAFGYIQPIGGALLQEGIDVAVILNALRALRG
jgi:heavy metal translocating P-type ATPase